MILIREHFSLSSWLYIHMWLHEMPYVTGPVAKHIHPGQSFFTKHRNGTFSFIGHSVAHLSSKPQPQHANEHRRLI